jgi:uncharacterized membrane protein
MQGNGTGTQKKDPIATGLGVFSIGLGAAQMVAPAAVERLIGLRGGGAGRLVMRAVGAREIASGVGILRSPRPAGWLRARVAGDVMDMALLGTALAAGARRTRVAAAMGAVAGVTVPDILESRRLENGAGPVEAKAAVTVNRPRSEVYAFWRDFANFPSFMAHVESVEPREGGRSHWRATAPAGRTVEWDAEIVEERPDERISWQSLPGADVENGGSVRFVDAPGGRGTEIHVSMRYSPPGGALGATVAKLFGEEPQQQAKDDLRRAKQILETGEIVRSDGMPEGIHAAKQMRNRPANPVEVAA